MIDLLLDINVGAMPNHRYECIDEAFLPSNKPLWEATTQSEWEAEYAKHLATGKVYRSLTFATLRNSQNFKTTIKKEDLDDLGSWSSHLDEFGTIFLMAALNSVRV